MQKSVDEVLYVDPGWPEFKVQTCNHRISKGIEEHVVLHVHVYLYSKFVHVYTHAHCIYMYMYMHCRLCMFVCCCLLCIHVMLLL